jgi:hypothetical protein
MPLVNGRTVMFMGQRGYNNSELFAPLEEALSKPSRAAAGAAGGVSPLDPAKLLAGGTPPDCHVGIRNATYFGGVDGGSHWPAQSFGAQFGKHVRTDEGGECVWSIKHANASCIGNGSCAMPRYIDAAATPIMAPISEAEAPAALRMASFPNTTAPTGP